MENRFGSAVLDEATRGFQKKKLMQESRKEWVLRVKNANEMGLSLSNVTEDKARRVIRDKRALRTACRTRRPRVNGPLPA